MIPTIRPSHLLAASAVATATSIATPASAEITSAYVVRYTVTAEDFGGTEVTVNVQDLYLSSNDAADTVLNVYNFNLPPCTGVCHFQSFTGTGWQPTNLGGPFDAPALRRADSFVTIGGFEQDVLYPEQASGSGAGSGLDPNFGGNNACFPGDRPSQPAVPDAGWYNGSPPSLNGQVGSVPNASGDLIGLGVLIGRFTYDGDFNLDGSTLEVTWNQGLGTPGRQQAFPIGWLLSTGLVDCNGNGQSDACEIANDLAQDCNDNGIPDDCDIAEGRATDYNGNDVPDQCEGDLVGTDHPTIVDAIAAAPDGGVVRVPAGTYDEAVVLDRGVILIAIDGPDQTTLRRSGFDGPAILADGASAGTVVSGFTIADTNNIFEDGRGGGIDATDSHLLIDNCVFQGNLATDGGGARFEGGAPIIRGCTFRGNGSLGVGGGLRLVGADATVESCTFEMNSAAAGALGWAIAATDGFPTFTDVEASSHDGQAVALESLEGFPKTIMAAERLRINGNIGRGLAILGNDPQTVTLTDSRICGNTDLDGDPVPPTDGAYTDLGGNILFTDRCPDLVVPDDAGTIQLAIDTATDGDRIAVRPGTYDEGGLSLAGRDLELVGVDDLFLAKPVVTGPIDASGMPETGLIRYLAITGGTGIADLPGFSGLAVGGGLVLDDARLLVQECDVFDNSADLGGGVFVRDGAARLQSVYIAQNDATASGGGLFAEGGAMTVLALDGCLIVNNDVPMLAASRGGGVDARGLADATSLFLANSSISGNARENLAQNTASGSYDDGGGNSIPDAFDCDGNGNEDAADIEDSGTPDCNQNLVPDSCDIADGTSDDCDGNGTPDACDLGYAEEPRYERHDGTSEKAEGATEAGTLGWLERFTGRPGLEEIRAIEMTFGEAGLSPAIIGKPVEVCIWSDPDGDGTPNDATLVASMTTFIEGPLGANHQVIELSSPVTIDSGSNFFVGGVMIIPGNAQWYPAAIDDDGGSIDSWIVRDASSLAPADIGAATVIERLSETGSKFLTSRWMITALPALPATSFDCNGNGIIDACEVSDGTATDCNGNGVPDSCDLGYTENPRYQRHDGMSEKAEGATKAGTLAWMEHFTGRSGLTELRTVDVTFGEEGLSPAIIGQPVQVCVWSDPDGDGVPNDALPLTTITTTIEGPLGGSPQQVDLPQPVSVGAGSSFFVGVVMAIPVNAQWYPAAMDDDGPSYESWIIRDDITLSPADIGSAGLIERLPLTGPKFASSRWMITAVPTLGSTTLDCNANGLIDSCEVADGITADCNSNGIPDECDVAGGVSDLDLDGIPDSCQDQLVFQVPERFSTISSAIDAAPEGSRIDLAPGNYAEAIDLGSRNLEIVGNPADPASTIIETPGMNMTVITIAGGQDASTLIAGVTIQKGFSSTPEPGFPSNNVGGGFYIDGSSPTIEDCIVGTNAATRGGGAYLRFSETVFRGTTFEGNTASGGGGGIWWSSGVVTLEGCTIRDNQTEGDGAGIRATASGGSITGGSVTGNLATDDGAGIWWQGSTAALLLVDVEISMNTAGGTGGGVYSQSGFIGIEPSGLTACENFPNQVRGPYTIVPGVSNAVCRCGDLNGDGEVDGVDLGLYLAVGGNPCSELEDCPADITFDGDISGADLGRLLGDWGFCN